MKLKKIKDSRCNLLLNDSTITDKLIDVLYLELLKEDEQKLLKLAFSDNLKQEDLDKLLSVWDIEVKGAYKSLLLAYVMKLRPEMKFREYEEPRLKGLLKYFRFQNLDIISHFVKIVRECNKQGIYPLILKGGAIRHLRPDLPRIMGDIDILVEEDNFIKSAEIAVKLGYKYDKMATHSIDIHKNDNSEYGILDIHKFIRMDTINEKSYVKDLFKRAKKEKVFGVEALVPAKEDLVFISLVNLARNLRDKTSQAGMIYSIFDCEYLQRAEGFDWNIVEENARKTNTIGQISFSMKFMQKISENLFKNNCINNLKAENYSIWLLYKRYYLEDIRNLSRSMKFKNIFKGEYKIKDFISVQTRYSFLKSLTKYPLLTKLLVKDFKKDCIKIIENRY